jgi:OOP family OmpA-OmpF porin
MRSTLTKTPASLAIACALALGAFSAPAGAQEMSEHGLVTSPSGQTVMSGFGLCVHSGFGPAPSWTAGCHAPRPVPVAQYFEKTIPAPAVAAAPLAVYEKVVFDVNVLFDSNKASLLPAGRDKLDGFVGKIRGLEGQSMLAVGYADRMGTDASNQTLSESRVNTVKAYLVSQGVASNRVDTSARGERQPSTYAGECKDANNAKNVACMQPDRHVFIEISGSRLAK